MHWKPRRPKWPYLVALCCLFALTLVAPRSWQGWGRVSPRAGARTAWPETAPGAGRTMPRISDSAVVPAPILPPVVEPEAPEPTLAGPVVAADDYVAVDEPLVEPTADESPPSPEVDPAADSSTLRPSGRSVLVRNVPAPAAPAHPPLSVEKLLQARDALLALVEQARQLEPPAARPANPLRVTVQNEHDRLAMVPDLAEPSQPLPAAIPELAPPVESYGPALRHRPAALIAELETLESSGPPQASQWSREVLDRLETLTTDATSVGQAEATVGELQSLAITGFNYSLSIPNPADQSAWLRATRSLDRRLPIWKLLVNPQVAADVEQLGAMPAGEGLIQSLHEVAALTAGSEAGASWRAYLRLDDLAGLTSIGGDNYVEIRRATARDVLTRMVDPWLTPPQREFLDQPPISAMARELRPWASGGSSLDALAALIERFESTGAQRDAAAIAELRLRMKWSSDQRLVNLSEDLNRHYRNANLRVAFSSELLNRLIPEQQPVSAPVREHIAGADVRGRSETNTQLHLRLLPDPTVWRFGLEVHGDVKSQTRSQTWPARLRNSSHMEYEARKLILVNRYGLHVWPAESRVEGRTELVGVDSTVERIPIIGGIVENAAREQHRQNRSRGLAQVKSRINREARERMDREADEKLHNLDEKFRGHILEPLERFALVAEPVDMSTTEQRANMRIRLAGEHQLAAYTPRPSAPSDSLASVQLHESAVNNALRGLELDGRRMSVAELHAVLSEKIRRHAETPPADLPARAKVQFAPHDAVRVKCRGDRIELVLNIVELRHGRDSIRNVGVHAFFRPVINGMELKLVRDGSLQFDGAHLRTGPRMVLHSVFGKLLPKDQEAPVLADRLQDDPRFAGLMVTQLVIEDGWVAVSVGPATPDRTAWRTREAEAR